MYWISGNEQFFCRYTKQFFPNKKKRQSLENPIAAGIKGQEGAGSYSSSSAMRVPMVLENREGFSMRPPSLIRAIS